MDDIGMALVRIVRMSHNINHHATKYGGLEKSAFMIVAKLAACGPRRASALADAVHSDPSTISRQVSHLVKQGLLERQADPDDGRASLLAATELGQELMRQHREQRNRFMAEMLAGWTPQERVRFAELISRFCDDYEAQFPALLEQFARAARATSGGE
ncbi:MarR family transcriptional regulator [Pseudonocardiaceae bacterium YIM PH 21723]|nr:MarR family transcriptional regulator [Pseudonocardiaceae bacterium YIM PH 21723]